MPTKFLLTLLLILVYHGASYAQTSADFSAGSVIVGADSTACSGAIEGSIRYSSANSCIELCDGVNWSCTTAKVSSSKTVFYTSTRTYTGAAVGGISGADAKCQSHASTAGLSGTYKAWISDDTSSPSTSFTQSTKPYRRVDGTKVADNWTDLTDGTLDANIQMDEFGVDGGTLTRQFWGNTNEDGTRIGTANDCSNWTSISGSAQAGRADQTSGWSDYQTDLCNQGRRLFCVQQ